MAGLFGLDVRAGESSRAHRIAGTRAGRKPLELALGENARAARRYSLHLSRLRSALRRPPRRRATLALEDVNAAELKPNAKAPQAVNIKAQVLLDRARFSPGAIDGRRGENFANALRAFQEQNGLTASGELDAATWEKLAQEHRAGADRIHDHRGRRERPVRRGHSRTSTRRRRS